MEKSCFFFAWRKKIRSSPTPKNLVHIDNHKVKKSKWAIKTETPLGLHQEDNW
jgi:hypothetical protein